MNPYVAGDPVGGSPAFVGRRQLLGDLLKVIRRPRDNGMVLFGQRRIGKTSILQQLAVWLPAEGPYRPIYFDLQDKAEWSLDRVLGQLASTIADALGQPDPDLGDDIETSFREAWLPGLLASLESGASLVLLFDEFDVLANPGDEAAANRFFPYLRELLGVDKRKLNFVFVIGRNVEDLDTIALSLFKAIDHKRVSLLTRRATERLIRLSEQEDGGLCWSDEAVERVWQLGSGHPLLTQQLCSHVWEEAADSEGEIELATAELVDAVVDETLDASHNSLVWLWDGLPPAERVVISALAEAGPSPISPDGLEGLLHEKGVRVVIRDLQNAPDKLRQWDVLDETPEGYRFRVELLRLWLERDKPLDRVRQELDRVEPAAHHLYLAAQATYRSAQIDLAAPLLRHAIDLNPNHLDANLLLAEILIFQGLLDEARQVLERLYSFQPAAARPRLSLVLSKLAERAETIEDLLPLLERQLEVDPNGVEAAAVLGKVRKRARGKSEERVFVAGEKESSDATDRLTDEVWSENRLDAETSARHAPLVEESDSSGNLTQSERAGESEQRGSGAGNSAGESVTDSAEPTGPLSDPVGSSDGHPSSFVSAVDVAVTGIESDWRNPFRCGKAVPPSDFSGRLRTVRRIVRRAVGHGESTAVVGEPRTGKTSLLLYLADRLDRRIYLQAGESQVAVYLDALTLRPGTTAVELWRSLFELARGSMSSEPKADISERLEFADPSSVDSLDIETLFRELSERKCRIVVLIDEFQKMLDHPHLSSPEFFGKLRSVASRYSSLALIVASHRSVAELNRAVGSQSSPYFNYFQELFLGPFDASEDLALLEEAKGRFSNSELQWIREMAGGQPYLLQLFASELWEIYEDEIEGQHERLESLSNLTLERASSSLNQRWRLWPEAKQKVLLTIGLAHLGTFLDSASTKRDFRISKLYEGIRAYGSERRMLKKKGFVIEDPKVDGGWRIRPQIYLPWIAEEATRQIDDGGPLGAWLQSQEWGALLTGEEQKKLGGFLQSVGEMTKSSVTTVIESVTKAILKAAG